MSRYDDEDEIMEEEAPRNSSNLKLVVEDAEDALAYFEKLASDD